MNGELHVALDSADFLVVFPLKGEGRARLIGTVRAAKPNSSRAVDVERCQPARASSGSSIDVERVNWFSTYRVHHRVADHFRKGRAFLLGDAAHIHSPVGGQGMNTGIGDAVNLAWKLAAVLARPRRCRTARQLRAGAHRLRPAAGRDHRPRLHQRHQLRRVRAA